MSFEKFSSKIQLAVDMLTDCGRPPHNGDIVDIIWENIQNSELNLSLHSKLSNQFILEIINLSHKISPLKCQCYCRTHYTVLSSQKRINLREVQSMVPAHAKVLLQEMDHYSLVYIQVKKGIVMK